jgi:hypothetical protein
MDSRLEGDGPHSVREPVSHSQGCPVPEEDFRSGAKTGSRSEKSLPAVPVVLGPLQKEDLHPAPSLFFHAAEAGGNDLGVVEDQEVPRQQKVAEVGEHAVANTSVFSVHHQEPRGVPGVDRILGDPVLWQSVVVGLEIEEVRRHGPSYFLPRTVPG